MSKKTRTGAERPRTKHPVLSLMLVDDHPILRRAVGQLLEHSKVGKVVAEASDGEEAVKLGMKSRPDVAIMDIDLPVMNGIEATKQLLEASPTTKILVLAASDERSRVIDAVRAGASGYLLKTTGSAEIVDAVRKVHEGELVFPPSLAEFVRGELRAPRDEKSPLDDLTKRELEILSLMAEGRSNQAICERLFLTPRTVESHIGHIFSKLGLEPTPDDSRRVLAVLTYLRSD